eukprot:15228-Heterococcus_DN1.PRE.2
MLSTKHEHAFQASDASYTAGTCYVYTQATAAASISSSVSLHLRSRCSGKQLQRGSSAQTAGSSGGAMTSHAAVIAFTAQQHCALLFCASRCCAARAVALSTQQCCAHKRILPCTAYL